MKIYWRCKADLEVFRGGGVITAIFFVIPNPNQPGQNIFFNGYIFKFNWFKIFKNFCFYYPTKYGNEKNEFQNIDPSDQQRSFDPKTTR